MDIRKSCFVISPIGAAGSAERKRSDTHLKHIFRAALEPLGFEVVRADEISEPGSITLQVLARILESDLVIADLTDHNPNVFYELAVRHASEKPVIHTITTGQSIPFDIADLRTIYIDIDLDGAERSRKAIAAQVSEIEQGRVGQTPVKLAGVIKHISSSNSDDKLLLTQILDGLTEIRTDVRKDVQELASNLRMHFSTSLAEAQLSQRREEQQEMESFAARLRYEDFVSRYLAADAGKLDQVITESNKLRIIQSELNKLLKRIHDEVDWLKINRLPDSQLEYRLLTKAGGFFSVHVFEDSAASLVIDKFRDELSKLNPIEFSKS
jgi:hypothetical protein